MNSFLPYFLKGQTILRLCALNQVILLILGIKMASKIKLKVSFSQPPNTQTSLSIDSKSVFILNKS